MGLLAVGFSNGIFELLQLPDLTTVHTLSIGRWAASWVCRAVLAGRCNSSNATPLFEQC